MPQPHKSIEDLLLWFFWKVTLSLLHVLALLGIVFLFGKGIHLTDVFANAVLLFFALELSADPVYQLWKKKKQERTDEEDRILMWGTIFVMSLVIVALITYTGPALQHAGVLSEGTVPVAWRLLVFQGIGTCCAIVFAWRTES